MKENERYFLAITVRVNCKPQNKYFLGLVCCAKNKILYDLKLMEKSEIVFQPRYKHSTLKKYEVLLLPNKDAIKSWHKALKKYFKGKNAMIAWVYQKLKKQFPDVNAMNIDFAETIIGEITD